VSGHSRGTHLLVKFADIIDGRVNVHRGSLTDSRPSVLVGERLMKITVPEEPALC
jgi:hypothetical protein